ncbi:tryptophan-rich sensory protein [Leifsonia shinshuensis]|uniref:Tryptophan-rich sensory protein n=1 Tax=Leifsonia shinshuensis TaxID=150026 RepID=A0A7G6YCV9_9MICO|nr:tryptophan-rich sensory protein [Leifsonia shinshuensis]QNE36324.1 tryptophan-rich sensory protein [Leifsonia shinshuensis]
MTSLTRRLPLGVAHPTVSDRIRQSGVIVATVVALAGAVYGSGLVGGQPIPRVAGGALGPDATLLAPAGPAFAIWSVIYLGLAGYAIWQVLPSQAARRRQRAAGYWILASLLLNAAWILAVQAGLLTLSVPVIVLLLAVLAVAFVRLRHEPGGTTADAVLLDGTVGLYLGWVMVATAADAAAWLQTAGFTGFGAPPEVWAMAVLAALAAVACALAVWDRGRLTPALASAWGLVWIAVSRVTGGLPSAVVAVTALAAGILVIMVAVAVRVARGGAVRRS